jgi:hypothetical protein
VKLFRLFDWLLPDFFQLNVAGAIVGGAIIGGVANSMSASSAADAQTAAANQANATSMAQYNQTRADNQPYMTRGNTAGNDLQYRMGLSTSPTGNGTTPYTLNDFIGYNSRIAPADYGVAGQLSDAQNQYNQYIGGGYGTDQASIAKQFGFNPAAIGNPATAQADPNYGSLTKSFTQNDLNNDVVYNTGLQFGLDQGTKGINNQAAATGSMLSGATLKALTQYGNDYGSQKAGDAWNRWNTDNTNTFNRLSGIAGTGQQANSLVANTGASTAGSISANQIGVGNAQAASAIGSGNAFSSGISSAINGYQTNQLLSGIRGGSGTGTGSPNIYGANGAGNSFVSSPNIYGANGGTGSAMVAY